MYRLQCICGCFLFFAAFSLGLMGPMVSISVRIPLFDVSPYIPRTFPPTSLQPLLIRTTPSVKLKPASNKEKRYLFLVEPNYGAFSNNRISMAEAMGIARHAERALYVPPFRSCGHGAGLSVLWNLTRMGATLETAVHEDTLTNEEVSGLCGVNERLYVWVEGFTKTYLDGAPTPTSGQTEVLWRGQVWPVKESRDLSFDFATAPPDNHSYIRSDKTNMFDVEPYKTYYPKRSVTRDFKGYLIDDWLPLRIAALPHKCVAIHALYFQTNWAVIPGMLERVVQTFHPSVIIDHAVTRWFAKNNVEQHKAVGVHLRLGNMVTAFTFGLAYQCTRNASFLIDDIRRVQHLSRASAPVLVASDTISGPCALSVLGAFSESKIVTSDEFSGCAESFFTQEVLGRTIGFVGNSLSTFSMMAAWHRLARGANPETNSFPEGPDPAPMTSYFS